MERILVMFAIALLMTTAFAGGLVSGASADETVAADQAADEADNAEADAAPRKKAFEPPPGYRTKKFGDKVLYCTKDTTIGTRFKSERCYDEAQLKEFLAAQEQNKADIDRVRSICSNPGICAPQ